MTAFALSATASTPQEAARFLAQATLGSNWDEIQYTAAIGSEAWVEEQFEQPIGYHQPALDARAQMGLEIQAQNRRWS